MTGANQDFFWVIFDTCTRPTYYEDVHNILALPEGCVYRYDYRGTHLTPSALQAADLQTKSKALLVYAQVDNYQKGDSAPPRETETERIIWVPTRLADIVLIPPKEGETYNFDIRLGKYPENNQASLLKILEPLINLGETPFTKWVATSHDFNNLQALENGEDDKNWETIVNMLNSPSLQFKDDLFWRLRSPIQHNTGRIIKLKFQEIPVKGSSEIRKIESYYESDEGLLGAFELVSYSHVARANQSPKFVHISANEKAPIYSVGDNDYQLRPHGAKMLKFATKRSELLSRSFGPIKIESDENNGWTYGANLSIDFNVRKPLWKILLASCLALLSIYLGLVGATWKDSNPQISVIYFLFSLVLLGIIYGLLFAKLKVPES